MLLGTGTISFDGTVNATIPYLALRCLSTG